MWFSLKNSIKRRVFIIEPDDDKTFKADMKGTPIESMLESAVVREIPGGHLAIMLMPIVL